MTTNSLNDHLGPVHNSHLTAFRRCPKKFEYAYVEGIQPKTPSLPLARGIWLHYCLQAQYLKWGIEDNTLLITPVSIQVDGVGDIRLFKGEKSGTNEEEVSTGWFLEVVTKLEGEDINGLYDQVDIYPLSAKGMLQLLTEQVWARLFPQEHEKYTEDDHTLPEAVERILIEYFYFYREELKDRTFEVLLVEEDWKRDYKGLEFEGRTDSVIRMKSNGLLVCRDWKSTKSQPHKEFKFMESQLNLYPWGMAEMLVSLGVDAKDVENMAVEFDYLSTKLPTTPSQNKDGSLSKRKINTTYLTLRNAIKEYGLDKFWKQEDYDAFLARNEREFFERKRLPRNKRVVKTLLEENLSTSAQINAALQMPEYFTRTVSNRCSFDCDFLGLCKGELYGENVSSLRKKNYEPRTNTHAGVVDKEED